MPERKKADFFHAGNLYIARLVCDPPSLYADGCGCFMNTDFHRFRTSKRPTERSALPPINGHRQPRFDARRRMAYPELRVLSALLPLIWINGPIFHCMPLARG